MIKTHKSKILAAAHETASDFKSAGLISAEEMAHFDQACLAPKSPALAAIHESMKDLNEIGVLSDEKMKEFDKSCLVNTDSSKKSK